ncbi:MAG: ABC transporter ATP-binding protein [Treponema sp. GWB1_62_6]|nr:MAG: ABC transporter ATP-binding protein [Treponema sp. GWA1_62_8]OHE65842.1 MAG: ABC transporter ATP-binding protein [Treponema sp. GWC1_61_84]OHE72227.1 MAG: ABC transporter ATP-binding protein [Treponema sp. GWB1_62_6]OHE72405.1 MAG: ABC transporter ATP-binding protein [Treponema sp. RIFOXYC1_FULL_61_9]HCM28600.1 ABC transporter ATP-binding protein [Treponema sp.]
MLTIENLTVNYGHISALTDVTIHVNEGEIITLIGGNGAGKTTTLMSISNLIEKSEGRIMFKGVDITDMPPHKIVKMGICHVPEGRRIFPALTVRENLIAGTIGNPSLKKADAERLFEEVYALFPRLSERMDQGGGSLSGGEQQMLAIARGLMMEPDIIMLDEPSLGLAPILVEEIFELILEIKRKGKTILLIEQNASMALQVADRGYVLVTGRVSTEGTGKDLLVNPEVRNAYLGI